MRILRKLHSLWNVEKTSSLLEFCQNCIAQITDVLPFLSYMLFGTAVQRLVLGKLVVGADSNFKLEIQYLCQCALPFPDVEIRNDGEP